MTYTLDWSETDLGGTAVVSYGSGAILDFTDKPSGATSALSITSNQSDGVDNILAEFEIVTTGSSVMTFDYKVSTESGWDKFHIDVDGVSNVHIEDLAEHPREQHAVRRHVDGSVRAVNHTRQVRHGRQPCDGQRSRPRTGPESRRNNPRGLDVEHARQVGHVMRHPSGL